MAQSKQVFTCDVCGHEYDNQSSAEACEVKCKQVVDYVMGYEKKLVVTDAFGSNDSLTDSLLDRLWVINKVTLEYNADNEGWDLTVNLRNCLYKEKAYTDLDLELECTDWEEEGQDQLELMNVFDKHLQHYGESEGWYTKNAVYYLFEEVKFEQVVSEAKRLIDEIREKQNEYLKLFGEKKDFE